MNKLLSILVSILCVAAPVFAKVTLTSYSHTYQLQTTSGSDVDQVTLPSIPLTPCVFVDTVSAYSSHYCWSPGSGDPIDSAWALLFGQQKSCATPGPGAGEIRAITSAAEITGGVIFPGCDLGNPTEYEAVAHSMVSFVFNVVDAPVDYELAYDLLGEDWGGEIMGGNTAISGFVRLSVLSGATLVADSLFAGADVTDSHTGTLQPGNYSVSYEINHLHNGSEPIPWFPAGHSRISFELNLGSIVCGDLDGSARVDVGDAVYLINYIFGGGPAPQDEARGDVDCNNRTDVGDAVYMINFIFAGGAAPCALCN